jgi:predicted GNAT family acetyltransferase
MRCVLEPDLATFAPAVLPWLERDPVLNNVLCSLIGARYRGEEPVEPGCLWARVEDDAGALVGVAVRTPPFGVLVSNLDRDAASALADALADHDLPAVNGPVDAARAFAAAWRRAHPVDAAVRMSTRMHRLDAVVPPPAVPGGLRLATAADRDLALAWTDGFVTETGSPHAEPDDATVRRIAAGQLRFWTVDGEPVSMLADRPPVAGVPRISLVYTPPERRRHGYAAAAVAALSQELLDRGAAACMLYTDLANPTSNGVYRRIGYRPVIDAELWEFTPAG